MSSFSVPICKIDKVYPHDNADRLEIATLEGMSYHCIVQKDLYSPGDAVFYIPVDSVVPAATATGILNLDYLKSNGRVRAVRLRGVYSEGIIMPLRDEFEVDWMKYKQGDDVSKEFSITKYEPPPRGGNFAAGKARYTHPDFVKYTNIENIKKYPNVLKDDELVTVTEKLHGSNVRFGWLPKHRLSLWEKIKALFRVALPYELVVGSHNVQVANAKNIYYETSKPYHKAAKEMKDFIFFGEMIGHGVQKNYDYGLENKKIIFFDIYNTRKKEYVSREIFVGICNELQLPTVPVVHTNTWDQVKQMAPTGPSHFYVKQKVIEGWVIEPIQGRIEHSCGRVIFKQLNEKYLLDKNNTDFK